MLTIWKFELDVADELAIDMPAGARLLSVQTQRGQPCLWALVDPDAPRVERKLSMRSTGHLANGLLEFVGTFQLDDGQLVFHVFDQGES